MAENKGPSLIAKWTDAKIATRNLHGGLKRELDKEQLCKDMRNYNIKIAALQETYTPEEMYVGEQRDIIISMGKSTTNEGEYHYGQGFYISSEARDHVWGHKRINNRICILQIAASTTKNGQKNLITFINAYAPTSMRTRNDKSETERFYEQLNSIVQTQKQESSIVIVMGDFNGRIGQRKDGIEEAFMGKFGKGSRNENGNYIANFAIENHLYISNTAFQHPLSKRATWRGFIHGTRYFNQIDYIMVPSSICKGLKNSRVHHYYLRSLRYESDHGMVITTIDMSAYYKEARKPIYTHKIKFDLEQLRSEGIPRKRYQDALKTELEAAIEANEPKTPNEQYINMIEKINKVAAEIIPRNKNPRQRKPIRYSADLTIIQLARMQRKLYGELFHKNGQVRKSPNRNAIKKERNKCAKTIAKRIRQLEQQEINQLVRELEETKTTNRYWEVQKILRKIETSSTPLQIVDPQGILSDKPKKLESMVRSFYENFFKPPGREPIAPWEGPPSELAAPFTTEQIQKALTKLRNRRTCGEDQIHAELLKYGGDSLAETICKMFNSIFEQHEHLDAIGKGILLPLNKPGKPKTVDNTRAITLLNIIRKLMSIAVLERIYPDIDKYLPPSQSGFRRGRSTADVVWSYRWIDAIAKNFDEKFNIMGIDMSKAFDTIHRDKLMDIINDAVPCPSNRRILRYLLSNTTLTPKINGEIGVKFDTIIGTPQGDALSPVLFTIYLEGVMREFRRVAHYTTTPTKLDTIYADDVDFINTSKQANEATLQHLEIELPKAGLLINGGKTEYIDIHARSHPQARKLGSRIDPDTDIQYRITAGNIAFRKLRDVWKRKKIINSTTKIQLYNATITSILTYNLGSSNAHANMMKKLDTTHRKHLRQILNIYYPRRISNNELYKTCNTTPMSQQVRTLRWQLFGHILRQPLHIPPQKLMDNYMTMKGNRKFRKGGQFLTLPRLLNTEMQSIGRTFKSMSDLVTLRQIAANRPQWIKLREDIASKMARKEKITEAQRKGIIIIPISKNMHKRSTEDHPEENHTKRARLFLKIQKRKLEAIEIITEDGKADQTVRLWKRHRQDSTNSMTNTEPNTEIK